LVWGVVVGGDDDAHGKLFVFADFVVLLVVSPLEVEDQARVFALIEVQVE
jgi:hypothetical protein